MATEWTILVTGGAGFIGSHTCKLLSRSGFTPVCFDNLATGHHDTARYGPFVYGDIRNRQALDRAMEEWAPSAVIHFAASAYVGESVMAPDAYYNNNVTGLLTLLDCVRAHKVRDVVFSSSCATYGCPAHLPITEGMVQKPINPYGQTKLIGEHILLDYGRAFGIRSAALRYFNAAGADRGGELAERHSPETHLIPRALMAASGRIPHLDIFGDDYDTPDGTCVRDFIHVEDLAEGHCLALDYLQREQQPLAVNLGTGTGTSIRQVVSAVERLSGRNVCTRVLPRREGDPASLFADASLARERLGFAPRCSDLATLIRSAMPSFGLEPLTNPGELNSI